MLIPIPVRKLPNLCGLSSQSCVSTSLLAAWASRVGTSLSWDEIFANLRQLSNWNRYNFDGEYTIGNLIVAAEIADEVLDIFQEIFDGRFPIHSIRLIDYFNASDYLSMAANNSHSFNFRYIAGTNRISRHGFGMAIDINPIQNPYIRGGTIWPAAGAEYLNRSYVRPGMIIEGDVVYTAFTSRGWIWGGHWTTPRDYHQFERRP